MAHNENPCLEVGTHRFIHYGRDGEVPEKHRGVYISRLDLEWAGIEHEVMAEIVANAFGEIGFMALAYAGSCIVLNSGGEQEICFSTALTHLAPSRKDLFAVAAEKGISVIDRDPEGNVFVWSPLVLPKIAK